MFTRIFVILGVIMFAIGYGSLPKFKPNTAFMTHEQFSRTILTTMKDVPLMVENDIVPPKYWFMNENFVAQDTFALSS